MDKTRMEAVYNYRPVNDRLATSGQPSEAQLRGIAEAGYRVVINLALHDDPRYSLKDERASVESLGMRYIHIPVQFKSPTHDDLQKFFDAMDEHRDERIWLHCAANMRVSCFFGLYQVIREGLPQEQAFDVMDSVWEPDEVWTAFMREVLVRNSEIYE